MSNELSSKSGSYPREIKLEEPFDVLWSRTHQPLCRFVCSRVSNSEDAEDILQDIFLSIYRQRHTLRDPDRLESWMYQVARNRIIDYYRRPRRWVDLSETLASEECQDQDAHASLLEPLQKAIASLPDSYRQALLLADVEGISQQVLAHRLGIGLSGVKSRVQRARSKVKESLLECFNIEFDIRGQVMEVRQQCCC